MGGMWFDPGTLADSLSETVGYKAGLALSIKEMCDHLSGTDLPDLIYDSEEEVVRLRSEEYAHIFYKLLHCVGYTREEYDGDLTGSCLFHKYRDTPLWEIFEKVTNLYVGMWPKLIKHAKEKGTNKIDPTPFARECQRQFGTIGFRMAIERIDIVIRAQDLHPYLGTRYNEWKDIESLSSLFEGSTKQAIYGKFFDQRFIDYLSNNPGRISQIHWRKFEELTAEYFERNGYQVDLGPGSNDDGVDIRIWKENDNILESPHAIIQCKRQKSKIEKIIIKGLYADMQFEKANLGLIVTTSELSPGSRKTISVRGYPIREVNKNSLLNWLDKLRTPGTGIIRR